MPKGSEELTNARKEEIISACAELYLTKGFRDITISDIGNKTSFTRTSIYNYFQTKEEIFLALLQREHEAWRNDLQAIVAGYKLLNTDEFAGELAHTLEKRGCMLKLMSMNLYDMERSSRLENLVELKKAYGAAMQALDDCLQKFFPQMTESDRQEFLFSFFPFLFGVYPYTSVTAKQMQAMETAGVSYPHYSIYGLTKTVAAKLLAPFK